MKVIILCGGKGTRLREETEYRPKPMVEIGNKPILWHIMKIYAHYGFKDFILCLGYKGDIIRDYFYNYEIRNNDFTVELGKNQEVEIESKHNEQGWRVTLAETGDEAMTGARVKRVEKYIEKERFMLTYGDGVADINLKKLVNFHRSHKKLGTVTAVHPLARFGKLGLQETRVESFTKKDQVPEGYIDGGFFIFERDFFDRLWATDDCVLEQDPLENLAQDGELMSYKHEGFWHCMDTYRDVSRLNELWDSGKAPWKVWA